MNVVLALKELGIPKTKYQVDGSCKLPDFFLRSYEDAPGRDRVALSEPICRNAYYRWCRKRDLFFRSPFPAGLAVPHLAERPDDFRSVLRAHARVRGAACSREGDEHLSRPDRGRWVSFRARVAGLAGAGPGLILLHGFPESSITWTPLLERAAETGF